MRSKIYTADFTHDFDTAQLRAILNSHEQNVASAIDCDYNSNTSCFAGEINDFENLSLELKLVSTGGGSLNWASRWILAGNRKIFCTGSNFCRR